MIQEFTNNDFVLNIKKTFQEQKLVNTKKVIQSMNMWKKVNLTYTSCSYIVTQYISIEKKGPEIKKKGIMANDNKLLRAKGK
jgi:hypothetical protein